MAYLNVLDESVPVQDHCIQMDFQGAGVTVTRPSNNDSVVVTIPGAANVTGWTDDGAIVRLTTAGDNVVIGAADIIGTEKLRVVNAAGVAIRVEGRLDLARTGVAVSAATQAASYVTRFTASMLEAAGVNAVDRDFDVYAGPSILTDDETTAVANLRIDYEGSPLLRIRPNVATPTGNPICVLISDAPDSGSGALILQATANFGAGNIVFLARHNDGGNALFWAYGSGRFDAAASINAGTVFSVAGTQVVAARQAAIPDLADGVDVGPDNSLRATVRTILATLRTHGLIAP